MGKSIIALAQLLHCRKIANSNARHICAIICDFSRLHHFLKWQERWTGFSVRNVAKDGLRHVSSFKARRWQRKFTLAHSSHRFLFCGFVPLNEFSMFYSSVLQFGADLWRLEFHRPVTPHLIVATQYPSAGTANLTLMSVVITRQDIFSQLLEISPARIACQTPIFQGRVSSSGKHASGRDKKKNWKLYRSAVRCGFPIHS